VDEFVCTMEHGSTTGPSPIVFTVDVAGLSLVAPEVVDAAERSLEAKALARPGRLGRVAAAAAAYGRDKAATSQSWRIGPASRSPGAEEVRAAVLRDRGASAAPTTPVGFGRR
jgi:hypothetical protein